MARIRPQRDAGAPPGAPAQPGTQEELDEEDDELDDEALDAATRPAPPPPEPVVPPKQYRAVTGGRIVIGGVHSTIKPGKVVDARHYDIEALRQQGIRLDEMTAAT